ncbi:putative zinc-binding protein [Paucibacter sp. APW11]|uniref:Zinc-binding protein n=1 Tax=Roseateles aquae TaxID=3077235 RepID=A0ABU3P642_9BURK|nr:putative zinc-binding protein [Paucibacter sp. APW11]MDT8998035.1 putative zinc-binding protein [Paucibacter sp. APW11]
MSESAQAPLPLVYSCSGCSDAAQLANHLAVRLDRAGLAEMSCIAGVGGGVPSLVRKAREAAAQGRPLLALDGCALACSKACLAGQGLRPTHHIRLHEMGVRKHYHADFDVEQADKLFTTLAALARAQGEMAAARPANGDGA